MKSGRIMSIQKAFGKDVAVGEIKDDMTGINYSFEAPLRTFLRDEDVLYEPIDSKQDMAPGDYVHLKKK